MNDSRILYLFTRTPLHVGAGASVGAIDQPIQRERHTGFPVIPGSTIKGVFADDWMEFKEEPLKNAEGGEVKDKSGQPVFVRSAQRTSDGLWLFGAQDANQAAAGALQFSEARLLVFPIRSARGSFAWITSPLLLRRAVRDGVFGAKPPFTVPDNPAHDRALFSVTSNVAFKEEGKEAKEARVVLEEYTFGYEKSLPEQLGPALAKLPIGDDVWQEVATRLVVVSDGTMSHFATTACEVAQHVRISDETGTADPGGLFNQENVPAEALFYAVVYAFQERIKTFSKDKKPRSAKAALDTFGPRLCPVYQFGGDASSGLGYCTVKLIDLKP